MLTPAGFGQCTGCPRDDSGFDNLVLAGDWTKNGIDGGCVEAAVIVRDAGRPGKLTGAPAPVHRSEPSLAAANAGPASRRTSSTAVAPPPRVRFCRSKGNAARASCSRATRTRIADLVRPHAGRAPAGPEIAYRAIGSNVLLMVGATSTRVSSMASPFDRWGTVQRDHGRLLDPGDRRPRPRRDLRRRAPRPRGPLRLRRQLDVAPGRARDLWLREDRWDGSIPATGSASSATWPASGCGWRPSAVTSGATRVPHGIAFLDISADGKKGSTSKRTEGSTVLKR